MKRFIIAAMFALGAVSANAAVEYDMKSPAHRADAECAAVFGALRDHYENKNPKLFKSATAAQNEFILKYNYSKKFNLRMNLHKVHFKHKDIWELKPTMSKCYDILEAA